MLICSLLFSGKDDQNSKAFLGIQGNKSFYESELIRKVLQTLRGKDFTEALVLRVRRK